MAPPLHYALPLNDKLERFIGAHGVYCDHLDLLSGAVSQVQDELKLIEETLQDFRSWLGGFDRDTKDETSMVDPEC